MSTTDDVRGEADLEQSAALQAGGLGGEGRHLADRLLEAQRPSRRARTCRGCAPRTPSRADATSPRRRCRRSRRRGESVQKATSGLASPACTSVLVHHEDDAGDVRAVGDDEVDQGVARILLLLGRDLRDGLALVGLELRVQDRGDEHPVRPARAEVLVATTRSVSSSISFLAFSRSFGSARRLSSASRPPSRIQGGRHASRPFEPAVQGYWLAADVDALVARGLDLREDRGHLAPVGLVGRLQVPDLAADRRLLRDPEDLVERACRWRWLRSAGA